MKRMTVKPEWILLVHLLPPKPTSLRVSIWRKLQKLGAVAIKNSVYALPFNEKTDEDFQWLKQEIESAGGEATVFRAAAVEGATDEEMIAAFQRARDAEYASVTAEFEGLSGAIGGQRRGGHLSLGRVKAYEADLDRLHKELDRIIATDFFPSVGRAAAVSAYQRCRKALRASQPRNRQARATAAGAAESLDRNQFQGRRWVTRQQLFVDRLATIWLIKRFIDGRPRFAFIAEGEAIEEGIAFDIYGAEFSHQGDDCTFETMMKRFGLGDDPALRPLAEIVHDIDLKDDKFNRLEAPGLSAIIRGLAEWLNDDRKLMAHCLPILDGLYELFGRVENAAQEETGEKQSPDGSGRRRARKRP